MKFCADCKYHFLVYSSEERKCKAPGTILFRDRVTGDYPDCSDMRKNENSGCGNDACWYKPEKENE